MSADPPPKPARWASAWLWALAGLVAGLATFMALPQSWVYLPVEEGPTAVSVQPERWACPMQCVIVDGPGTCPVCGMDLEKLPPPAESLALNEAERRMVQLRTAPVERRVLHRTLETFGRVAYNERHVETVTAWVEGRIVELFADATYSPIRRGDHVFALYSPELRSAAVEFLAAERAKSRPGSEGLAAAARERLELYGLTESQILALQERGKPESVVEIRAPVSGTITELHVREGEWVQAGAPIYAIADYDWLWLLFDAYEADLPWLAVGQGVDVELEALPGRTFSGSIELIEDVVDPQSRTVKVRVALDNRTRDLKPGMFASVRVHATLGSHGHVVAPTLEGRWWCYMHPSVRRSSPGSCPECGMPLELSTNEADERAAPSTPEPVLAVPRSAVLETGSRHLVYVMTQPPRFEKRGDDWLEVASPAFTPREVQLGPRAGDWQMVIRGVEEGERVATRGAMLIDSQLELLGQPSLTHPAGTGAGAGGGGHHHEAGH